MKCCDVGLLNLVWMFLVTLTVKFELFPHSSILSSLFAEAHESLLYGEIMCNMLHF